MLKTTYSLWLLIVLRTLNRDDSEGTLQTQWNWFFFPYEFSPSPVKWWVSLSLHAKQSLTLFFFHPCGKLNWIDYNVENKNNYALKLSFGSLISHKLYRFCVFFDFVQVFLLQPSIRVREGDELNVSFSMNRSKENHRLMEVELGCEMREASGKRHPSFSKRFYIEWERNQMFWTSKLRRVRSSFFWLGICSAFPLNIFVVCACIYYILVLGLVSDWLSMQRYPCY